MNGECRYRRLSQRRGSPQCRVAIGGDIDSRSGARSQRAASRLISTPGAVPTTNDETNPISPNPHGNNAFPANGSLAPTARDGCRAAQSRSCGLLEAGQSFYDWYRAPHSRWFPLALGRLQRPSGAWGGATASLQGRIADLEQSSISARLFSEIVGSEAGPARTLHQPLNV